jgi:hypothetical protein
MGSLNARPKATIVNNNDPVSNGYVHICRHLPLWPWKLARAPVRRGKTGPRERVASPVMESTWESRHLPVLDAAVRYIEEHGMRLLPEAEDLAEMTGLDPKDVGLALMALRDEYLAVEISGGGLENAFVRQVYPSARRAVGQWPTPENLPC